MTRLMVHNRNSEAFLSAIEAIEKRGAEEACLMIVDGEPGLGKSAFAEWWAVNTQSIYIRARKEWTPAWMMRDMLKGLGLSPLYSFERMYHQVRERLMLLADEAMREKRSFGIVIDEVDHISRKGRLLETLRDLSDDLEIPFILIGMGKVRHNLVRFPQVASRVGQYVAFEPISFTETIKLTEKSQNIIISEELIAFLHQTTKGRLREIKEGLQAFERFAIRNRLEKLTFNDMIGQTLFMCRKTGRPVKVVAK
ncbi:MAG: ATP-binding protein [Emcibacter sp.]|nr:ATP-binding protein [Emcibacter sp.]